MGKTYNIDPSKIDIFLKNKDIINICDFTIKIIHIPGHSPGSIMFYCKKENIAFSGDIIFKGTIGRYDLPGANKETLKKSILEKIYSLPDNTLLYPGHGIKTTVINEKKFNYFIKL